MPGIRKQFDFFTITAVFLSLLVLTAQAQSPALHVIGITGKWTAGKQQLVIGSSVSASSVLAGDAGATIMLGSSSGRYFKRCEDASSLLPPKSRRASRASSC